MFYLLAKLILRIFFSFTGGVKADGISNVPKKGPLIIVSNHQSILDPTVLMACISRRIHFLAAAYLFRIPVLNILLPMAGAIPVKSEKGDLASFKKALRILAKGGVIALFPEGGVSPDGSLRPFKHGWAYLALKSGAPVLPVAVIGTRDVLPVGTYMPRRGRIEVRVGECVAVQKKGRVRQEDFGELNMMMEGRLKSLLVGTRQ
ncbi:lysophospholipid acyltransferase family protein [Thermosediminibacter oceani]|uniref:Phospholipid/glycerol acyltransferase n=1 Tax=Thermosediminibacter oceani (strain ATCC BAA-1034 / DSM 16646 / JW/IW-1228P) TaxID=555079 RepID=D9RZG3_THEOJ|nr:lysophospholipid acyltransferase family protein [Thermosediminibacter oceani]ADL06861.1 phospholipid/glycerol acyltransferase [Thermosediminibacter oceani DSM 16646]